MTEVEAIQAILERWEDGWDVIHPTDPAAPAHVPYTYTSETFRPDELGDLGAWCRVSIIHTSAQQLTMGSSPNRKWERRGNAIVQVFAPLDRGRLLASELADDVRAVLEGQRLGDLLLYEGRTEEGGEDGAWWMVAVVVSFRYTDHR